MALGPTPSGRAIEQSAEELLRIWRLARAQARREISPGLLDCVMGAFFARCGQLLAGGGEPEAVWPGLVGIVRWSPLHGARELTGEWAIAMEVLTAACESFQADPKVAEWLTRAVAAAEKNTSAIEGRGAGAQPNGVVLLTVHGGLAAPRRGLRDED
ncbi:MAG TPA: hypothetical protein VFR85_15385 [Anaeromyxobacteraceae bacterium]|nr:hypothetical protein [Anaeromyxobacteraceae bacterium]